MHNLIKTLSDSQIDLHAVKAELDSDNEIWPVSSLKEDVRKEQQPAMFTFVSVNIKEVNAPFISMANKFYNISSYHGEFFYFYKFLESQNFLFLYAIYDVYFYMHLLNNGRGKKCKMFIH
jgi:hypothetical protein